MNGPDRYAVFGHPIRHSKSPVIHSLFAAQTGQLLTYTAEDVPAESFARQVDGFFASGGRGLNCTVPLKELAFKQADEIGPRAELAKAVNTLAQRDDGRLFGDNTDGVGLLRDLMENLGIRLTGLRVLILGAGGATRGILAPLLEQHPERLVIANRTPERASGLASEFRSLGDIAGCGWDGLHRQRFDVILNATAASLSGDLPPLEADALLPGGACYDLAYAQQTTPFVAWGQAHGARFSADGLGMLVEQAAEAFWLWRGVRPKTAPVIARLEQDRGFTTRARLDTGP